MTDSIWGHLDIIWVRLGWFCTRAVARFLISAPLNNSDLLILTFWTGKTSQISSIILPNFKPQGILVLFSIDSKDSYLYKTVQGNDPMGDLKLGWKTLSSLYKFNNQKTPDPMRTLA